MPKWPILGRPALGPYTTNRLQPACIGAGIGNIFQEKQSILVSKDWQQFEISLPVCSSLQVPAQLHMSKTAMGASQKDFESAMNQVKLLEKDPGNEVKLKLYALYKQVGA